MNSWDLTDLEFKVLCDLRCDGDLPEPFSFTSDIPTLDEYERQWKLARAELDRRSDSAFEAIAEAIAQPDVVVRAHAWDDADYDNPEKWRRVRAGRRGSRAFLITQLPGATYDHAGGFTISQCDPRALGEVIMATMPAAVAGRRPPIAIDLDNSPVVKSSGSGGSMIADDSDDSGFASWEFVNTRSVSTGTIHVVQGRSKFGPRGIVRVKRMWRDLVDDGRYVLELEHPAPVAVATSTARLAEWIDAEVEEVLARMDSHEEVGL